MTDKQTEPTLVIACEILQAELENLAARLGCDARLRFCDQDLHRTPESMPAKVQEIIDAEATDEIARVVLGYGLCSNGVVGVTAPPQGLIVPRVHDCIALFLGSRNEYDRQFNACPGTYYLNQAWIKLNRDPLGTMQHEYAPRMDAETAEWCMREEMKNQTRIALIDSGILGDIPASARKRARENAAFFEMDYEEITGSESYLARLLAGPWSEEDFVHVAPGQAVRQKPFM
ncbi:MAG: DUF1638 domain-containing protein [Phycisphaerae bacterium]